MYIFVCPEASGYATIAAAFMDSRSMLHRYSLNSASPLQFWSKLQLSCNSVLTNLLVKPKACNTTMVTVMCSIYRKNPLATRLVNTIVHVPLQEQGAALHHYGWCLWDFECICGASASPTWQACQYGNLCCMAKDLLHCVWALSICALNDEYAVVEWTSLTIDLKYLLWTSLICDLANALQWKIFKNLDLQCVQTKQALSCTNSLHNLQQFPAFPSA